VVFKTTFENETGLENGKTERGVKSEKLEKKELDGRELASIIHWG